MSKGLSKGITKENIVNTTLELIRDKENIRSVNLREIARALGCAHTNLYNHFSDLDAILWEAVDEVLVRSSQYILGSLDGSENPEIKLKEFFHRFMDFYLENKGWFRLFWTEKLQWDRPEKNKRLTEAMVGKYIDVLMELCVRLYNAELDRTQVMHIFHTIHCYMYGEVSIFIAGRGLISDETQFKKYVLEECVNLTGLLAGALK